jgi:hypothetical protein
MAQATLSTTERSAVPAIGQTRLSTNSAWVYPLDSTCFNTLNPATGEVIASVAQGGAAVGGRLPYALWHAAGCIT